MANGTALTNKSRKIPSFLGQKHVVLPFLFVSSVRSSYSHPDLLLITTTPLFQITPVLDKNIGLSLSEPLQLYKGYNAI